MNLIDNNVFLNTNPEDGAVITVDADGNVALTNRFITNRVPRKFWKRVHATLAVMECYWKHPEDAKF